MRGFALLILVELYMKNLIVVYADADMASLMILVSVEATEVFEAAVRVYGNLVAGEYSDAACALLPLLCLVCSSFVGKAVFSELLKLFLESYYKSCASYNVFKVREFDDDAACLRPCASVSSARIPRESEEMLGGDGQSVALECGFLVLLVKEETVNVGASLVFE